MGNQPATQVFGIELQPRLWASPSKLSSPMGSCLPCLVFLEQDCRRLDTCRMVEREEALGGSMGQTNDGSRSQIDRILERTNRQSRRACRFRVEQPMETREADHVERAGNGIVHTYYGKSRIKVMKLHMTQGFPVIFPPSAEYRCFLIADSDLDYRAMRHVLLPRYQYLGPCPGFEHRNWPWILRQQLIPSCL